jgi:CRP/FNR family transcriptional regulator, cyclic AMP receptor protein
VSDNKVHFGLFETIDDVVTLTDGEVLFREGDKSDGRLYVVRSGELQAQLGEKVVETFGPGEMFGELAIVDDGPRSATLVASGEAVVVPIDRQRFHSLVQMTPFFAENVMKVMAGRLRKANKRAS